MSPLIALLTLRIFSLCCAQNEVVVLDTLKATSELKWVTYPDDSQSSSSAPASASPNVTASPGQWQAASWTDPVTARANQGFSVCSVGEEVVDNWLRSPFIELPDVSYVHVNISFFMRECQLYPGRLYQCRTQFQLLRFESDIDFATATTPTWNDQTYNSVINVPADSTYISQTDVPLANNKSYAFTKSKSGFYLALRDRGMCAFILSVKIYYLRCPATVIRYVSLQEVPATSQLVTVYGRCVDHAVEADSTQRLQFLCTQDGNWFNPTNGRGCVCQAGYEPSGQSCSACSTGTYKSSNSNENCNVCPDNSESTGRALSICSCKAGFFRSPTESASTLCTKPPSPPQGLTLVSLTTTSASFSWDSPSFLGGRTDLYYTIVCLGCSTLVTYWPARNGSNETTVTLGNLVSNASYTLTVYANNGVSQLVTQLKNSATKTFATNDTVQLERIFKVESSSDSLTLTWNAMKDAAAYYVVYYPVSDTQAVNMKRVVDSKVTLSSLKDGTAYEVVVKYIDANDQVIGRSERGVFQTEKSDNSITMIAVAIVAVILCMGIVIVIVVMFLRRTARDNGVCAGFHKTMLALFRSKKKCTDKPAGDWDVPGPYSNVPFNVPTPEVPPNITIPLFHTPVQRVKTYVDPHTYEDPRQAVKEFTKEIDVKYITIEAVIGGGEFGDVCRGKLKCPRKMDMTVAIKTLKPGASEKNRLEFLTEASIMGQFEDPNVIFLEGVVTKSNPIMIVTEFMENGSLDTFLRANDGKLVVLQLLGMLRGISSGMAYLSEMSYVHRDLAARNILVNESLVCKVADFGLSREVEYDTSEGAYTTRGGKIPVRWTAPEAIAYRKFTTASDVWSFGVVMWEVMSYGERPYWNWSNQDVIKAVDRGYRLPPPMDCPEAVHQLMLDCWQKDRKNRPKFSSVRTNLDRLMQSPDLLHKMAKPSSMVNFDPEMPDITRQMTVSEWLQAIKMDRYTDTFAEKRIHTMDQVAWLTFADLLEMGVTLVGHQKKIMSSVQALRAHIEGSTSPVHVSEGFLV